MSLHVWEKLDLSFSAERTYANPYTDVEVWVDLEGPGFSRRAYGFWNGGDSFVVRVTATAPGTWKWVSGSSSDDPGLTGKTGRFEAVAWRGTERDENPNRRGMIRTSANGRHLEYADGTPFFLIGDTWWSVPSYRFPLQGEKPSQTPGPEASLEDYARYRRDQGFNCVGLIAAHPAWANDGKPPLIRMEDGTWVRAAWKQPGTNSAKDMHNEGGRPFEFPGKVPGFEDVFPDVDRINPDYFKVLDKKIDALNALGIVPFIEVSRRDTGQAWQKYHDWETSYGRYVQYVFRRYQANIAILSPIHYDYYEQTVPAADYNAAIAPMLARYGKPPFGTLLSANPNPSTYVNFGAESWIDLHQSGNVREHYTYWYLTEMFHAEKKPAINGEPYYAGLHQLGTPYPLRVEPNSEDDEFYVRSGLYGSFLSGGFAGFIYGAEGIWNAEIEPDALYKMWDAFRWRSASQIRHVTAFAAGAGDRLDAIEPDVDLVVPNKTGPGYGYFGWAYCARTPERDLFLVYFEKGAPAEAHLRGVSQGGRYVPTWFDPRSGEWLEPGEPVTVATSSILHLPERPDDRDWGLRLVRQ